MSVYIYAVNRTGELSACILSLTFFFSTKTKLKESGLIANKVRLQTPRRFLGIFEYSQPVFFLECYAE